MSKWKLIRYDAEDQRIWRQRPSRSVTNVYIADHSGDTGEEGDRHTAGNPDQAEDGPLRIDPSRMARMYRFGSPWRFTVPVTLERERPEGKTTPHRDTQSWAGCSLQVFAKLQELVPTLMIDRATIPKCCSLLEQVLENNKAQADKGGRNA